MQFIKGQSQQLENFLSAHSCGSLWHTPHWAAFQEKHGNPCIFFGVTDENEVLAAGIMQIRHRSIFRFGYIQGGILYKEENLSAELYKVITDGLKQIAKEKKLMHCFVDWVVTYNEKDNQLLHDMPHHNFNVKAIIPTFTNILDITKSEDEILTAMKPKGRYNIKLAEKKGVTVREGTPEEIPQFYHLLEITTARDGFRANGLEYYKSFLDSLPFARFMVAEHENEIISGGIFTYSGRQALYYYGASAGHKRNLMAPYLLQWEALRYGKANGCEYYDFMGIADPENEHDSLHGVTDFKLKFGNGTTRFLPAYDIVFSPLKYSLYRLALKIKHH